MVDNEFTRKEQICYLLNDYCDKEHKNCEICIAQEELMYEEQWLEERFHEQRMEELFWEERIEEIRREEERGV